MAETTRLIGAVGIKVRPVTKGFREEVQDALRRLPDGEVKVDVNADTRRAEQKIKEVSEDREVKIRVGVTHDEIAAAKKRLQAELKKLTDFKLPVQFDKQGLTDAIAKLDALQAKSKVVMKISEDKEGYESVLAKIRALQRERLLQEIKFEVDDDSLIAEAAKYERLIAEATKPREIEITYSEDRDSLARALDRVNGELAKLTELTIPITADEASLANARDALQEMLDSAPVTMRYGHDKAGFEAVLKKIASIRAEKLMKEVTFRTDENSLRELENEMREKLDALSETAKLKIQIEDTAAIRAAMAKIDAELKKMAAVTLELDIDEDKLRQNRADLEELLVDSEFELTYTNDLASLQAAKSKVESELSERTRQTITVDANEDSLNLTMAKIDELIHEAEKKKAHLPVEASGLKAAGAQLAWMSRTRIVPFYVRINQKSLAVAEGILKSLSGYNTLSGIGRGLESLVTKFDTIMLKAAGISTVLAGLVNTLTYATTAALGIGEGMSRAVGLLATAPAALTALAAGVLINIAAWKNFKGALDGNAEALASLPASARAAATALQGTWEQIQKPVQENYWDAMGTSLQDMVLEILPQVRDGLALTSTHVGRFGAAVADTIRELALTKGMGDTFANVAGFFDNATTAARPFTEAIATLGQRGAEYLPQFGTWLGEMATRFNNFIQEADGLGRINQWIEEGVQSLKDMWRAGDGVIDVVRGITAAAMDAGTNDLGTFADNMQRMGEIAQGEPFRSRLATIFEGARNGASLLNVGVKDLGRAFGQQAPFISNVLELLGELGGVTLTNISRMFSGTMFKSGLMDALSGLRDMAKDLEPSFSNVANTIGQLGQTIGSTFRNLSPLINTVTGGLSDVADALGDELPGAAEVLLRYMNNTFSGIASVVVPLSQALGNVLTVFNDLPGGVQRALVAFGAFSIMRGQVAKLFTALGDSAPFKKLETAWRMQQMHAGNANAATQRFVAGTAVMSLARERVVNVGNAVRDVGTKAQGAGQLVGGLSRVIGGGLMTAGKGLVSLLGGPWGIALGIAAAGLSLYGQQQAAAKQKVQDHTAALDEQTGALTQANDAIIANNIVHDKGSAGIKSSSETIKALGLSVQDTAKAVAEGGGSYDSMIAKLKEGMAAADAMSSGMSEMGIPIKGNSELWNKWTSDLGIASDAVTGVDLSALVSQLEAERASVGRSVDMWALRNDTMVKTSGISEGMAASIKVLGDSAGDAEGRLRAYRDILDELNGVSKTAWERQREMAASSRDLAGFLGEVNANGEKLNTGLIDLNTGFTIHTEAGDKLGGMLDNLQSQQFNAAKQAYDLAGGQENAAAAAAAAEAATAPYRDELARLQAQGLLSKDEVDALNRSLWGVPGVTPFTLTDEDSIQFVSAKLTGLHEQIQATPDKEITITEPLSPAVVRGLENLNYKVTHLEDGTIRVSETGTAATGEKITAEAHKKRYATITAGAITSAAETALNWAARGRTAVVEMKVHGTRGLNITEADGGILKGTAQGGMYEYYANGGINKMRNHVNNVKQFANGGFENHVAQISRSTPSTPVRIWSEPETGGEAYLPLHPNKRGRSTEILKQVAQQFGYSLRKGGATAYANGGIVNGGGPSTGGGVAVNIGSYVTQASDTPDDIARALMRRIKAQGAYSPLESF